MNILRSTFDQPPIVDLMQIGEKAIGNTMHRAFGGEILAFHAPGLPGNVGYCFSPPGGDFGEYEEHRIQGGESFFFLPVGLDGFLRDQPIETCIDEKTRIIPRDRMGELPPIFVEHSTTADRAKLIEKYGLFTDGEAIVNVTMSGDVLLENLRWVDYHTHLITFRTSMKNLSIYQLTGEGDGISICNRAPKSVIPGEVIHSNSLRAGITSERSERSIVAKMSYGDFTYMLPRTDIVSIQTF